jgi:hypothetical protein
VNRSTLVVAVVVASVAAAAAASAVHARGDHGRRPPSSAAAVPPSATAAAADTPPVGDVGRLPRPSAGELRGALATYDVGSCLPVVVDLGRLLTTTVAGMQRACRVWTSPGGVMLALSPPATERLVTARAIDGAAHATADDVFLPLPPAVTIADDGAVALCTGSQVLRLRGRRVEVARAFRTGGPGPDERCVTGALGPQLVQLAADRRRLVELGGDRTLLRLARPAPRPLLALVASSDGLVAVVDGAGGSGHVAVYGADGSLAVPRRPLHVAGRDQPVKVLLARGGAALALATPDGWTVTSLQSGRTLTAPGRELIYDVAFSPDGSRVAMATPSGIVVADAQDLTPRWLVDLPAQGVAWFDERRFPRTPTTPL